MAINPTMTPGFLAFLQGIRQRRGNLPGEPPLEDQIAQIGPGDLAASQGFQMPPTATPGGFGYDPQQTGGAAPIEATSVQLPPYAPASSNTTNPSGYGGATATPPVSASFPRPGMPSPLDLPQRSYNYPDPISPPTLAPPPTRNFAAERGQALKSAFVPGLIGLALGGAPGALAGVSGTLQGAKGKDDADFAQQEKLYGQNRANDLQGYGLQRQSNAEKMGRVTLEMRADALHDSALVKGKQSEWLAWTKEQDRLAKANGDPNKTLAPLLTHRAKTMELMSTQPEPIQRATAQDFNAIAAASGHPEVAFTVPESGPVFAMQPKDINRKALAGVAEARTLAIPAHTKNETTKTTATVKNLEADNTRADKDLLRKQKADKFDRWAKTRDIEIKSGRLTLSKEKAKLGDSVKGAKTWEEAQQTIANLNSKAALLVKPAHTKPFFNLETGKMEDGKDVPPSEDNQIAAHMYIEAGHALAQKFGKQWTDGNRWENISPTKTPTSSSGPGRDATMPGTIKAKAIPANAPRKPPSPPPSLSAVNARLKAFATPRPSSPKPSATPRPVAQMTKSEKLAEAAELITQIAKKKGGK